MLSKYQPTRDRCGEDAHEPHSWANGRYYCDGQAER
jgi:hypothetical protein